jgi:methyl-accepting chemotaxis protein
MGEAATGAHEMAGHIQEVTRATRDSGAAAGELLQASDRLARNAEQMRSRLDHFLTSLRAM